MGFTGLFAALADALIPAAEAAPALAEGAATGGELAAATTLPEIAVTAPAVAPAAEAGGIAAAADLIPEATGAGLSGLALDTGGSTLAASSLGPLSSGLGAGAGVAGATPAAGLGSGFSGVLGTGIGGTQFGDLSALLGPTTPDALSLGGGGVSPMNFATAAPQPGLVSQDFATLAGQGAPDFMSQIDPQLAAVSNTTPFAPASSPLAENIGLDVGPAAPAVTPTPQVADLATRGVTAAAPQVADVASPVAPINSLEAQGIPNLPAQPPSWFDTTAPGIQPPGPGATGIAAAAPAVAAPAAETAAAAAPAAAATPTTLASLSQYAPLGTLALGGAGLGLNIANTLNTPTAANVAQAPASDALAQTTPTMDANQMRQLLLNEGMSPQQADAYIAQINQRLAAQGGTTGSTDALNQGLVTAG